MESVYQSKKPCFQDVTPDQVKTLAAFIESEDRDAIYYTQLAKNAPTVSAQDALTEIAQDEKRHCDNLKACYFLSTGRQYMKDHKTQTPHIPFCHHALRQKFQDEMDGAQNYITAAGCLQDQCLMEQYQRLAEEENEHANIIRVLLAQML